jgi:hypothetical protein
MKRCFLMVGLFIALAAIPAVGQTKLSDPDKEADIRHLLKITGVEKIQQSMIGQMLEILKPLLPDPSKGDPRVQKMLDRMTQLLTEEFMKADFAGLTLSLYDKYFSKDDIKGLIQFYESPVGQKSIEVLPSLTQESMSKGMEMGQAILPKVVARMTDEFPELKSILKPPPKPR